jgi:hypothetical protein
MEVAGSTTGPSRPDQNSHEKTALPAEFAMGGPSPYRAANHLPTNQWPTCQQVGSSQLNSFYTSSGAMTNPISAFHGVSV